MPRKVLKSVRGRNRSILMIRCWWEAEEGGAELTPVCLMMEVASLTLAELIWTHFVVASWVEAC